MTRQPPPTRMAERGEVLSASWRRQGGPATSRSPSDAPCVAEGTMTVSWTGRSIRREHLRSGRIRRAIAACPRTDIGAGQVRDGEDKRDDQA
jgi:hypothetical protein